MADLAGDLAQSLARHDRSVVFYGFEGPTSRRTFATLGAEVDEASAALRAAGVGPGVVVALLGPTSFELCCFCVAVWSVGATLTVLPTPARLGSLETFVIETMGKLSSSGAGLLLGDPSMVEVFSGLVSIPCLSWQDLDGPNAELSRSIAQASDLEGHQAALVQFSSGTTREPRPILLSAEALLANSRAVLSRFPGGAERQTSVSWLPLYHDMGLIGGLLMPLLAPANIVLMGPEVFAARPVTWLEAISRERGTTSPSPNFALAHCADRIGEEQSAGLDLSCWEICMVGAEPVRPATLRRFAQRFSSVGFQERAFSPVYGLAEATLAVTFSPLGGGLKTYGLDSEELARLGQVAPGAHESPSLGRPLDGVEVSIRDDGIDVGEDRLGEVFVKSPSLYTAYLGKPDDEEQQGRKTENGWLRTGDMGFLHDGELHLYGRRRDILLLDGRNHDPSLLEGAVEALEPLRRCCAFTSAGDGADRDALILVCEVADSFSGDPDLLRDTIGKTGRAASGLTPARLLLVSRGALPATSSGKLRRAETARLFAENALELWVPTAAAVT